MRRDGRIPRESDTAESGMQQYRNLSQHIDIIDVEQDKIGVNADDAWRPSPNLSLRINVEQDQAKRLCFDCSAKSLAAHRCGTRSRYTLIML